MTFLLPALLALAAAGCHYNNPYAEVATASASSRAVVLERAYLGLDLGADGVAHTPQTVFAEGSEPTLSLLLSGHGEAHVQAILQKQEGGKTLDSLAMRFNVEGEMLVGKSLGEMVRQLGPGDYYVSIVVNRVPSWGIAFNVQATTTASGV
ncbi:hypothetical protein SN15_09275 [Stenotrophomonas maltophilia]|nr:hypothetical protein SN15_09275 [Stenotrophomonas maltophilia]